MNKLFTLLILALPLHAAAQDDTFGLDFSASAEKKLAKGVSFTLEGNLRTQENTLDDCTAMERVGLGGSLDVKVYNTKKLDLKLSAGWEYILQRRMAEREVKYEPYTYNDENGEYTVMEYEGYNLTDSYWRHRHRTTLALGASYTPNKRWSFSLKESVLYNHYAGVTKTTHRFRADDPADEHRQKDDKIKSVSPKDRFVLRSKATVKYDIRHSHFAPFASVDYGIGLNYSVNKWKYTAGTDYNLSKTNKLSLFYRFQTEDDDDEPNGHIVGVSYGIKF